MQVYGAYGVNLDAQFEPHNVPLLDRGWVLAFPHVRCVARCKEWRGRC